MEDRPFCALGISSTPLLCTASFSILIKSQVKLFNAIVGINVNSLDNLIRITANEINPNNATLNSLRYNS